MMQDSGDGITHTHVNNMGKKREANDNVTVNSQVKLSGMKTSILNL